VIEAPARRVRPQPEPAVVLVAPPHELLPEQLVHDDTRALLMLTPPSIVDFCLPPAPSRASAPTLPPRTPRVQRTREPAAPSDAAHEVERAAWPWRWLLVLVVAFALGLLTTTAIVVNASPTSCP
jgi:hypothetical protein